MRSLAPGKTRGCALAALAATMTLACATAEAGSRVTRGNGLHVWAWSASSAYRDSGVYIGTSGYRSSPGYRGSSRGGGSFRGRGGAVELPSYGRRSIGGGIGREFGRPTYDRDFYRAPRYQQRCCARTDNTPERDKTRKR